MYVLYFNNVVVVTINYSLKVSELTSTQLRKQAMNLATRKERAKQKECEKWRSTTILALSTNGTIRRTA